MWIVTVGGLNWWGATIVTVWRAAAGLTACLVLAAKATGTTTAADATNNTLTVYNSDLSKPPITYNVRPSDTKVTFEKPKVCWVWAQGRTR